MQLSKHLDLANNTKYDTRQQRNICIVLGCTFSKIFQYNSENKFHMVYNAYPVKNVTWSLMEIPCHFISQIHGSFVEIDTKSHDYSMLFIQLLFVFHAGTWHGFWTSLGHGISMAFAKKMMGFSSNLVSFSIKLPSKSHEKIRVTFFAGSFNRKDVEVGNV